MGARRNIFMNTNMEKTANYISNTISSRDNALLHTDLGNY